MIVYIVDIHVFGVPGYSLAIELERLGHLYGIGAVRPEEQLGIIEAVKVVYGRPRAELYALYLLKVDEEYLLAGGGGAAILYAAEGLLKAIAELAAEKAWHGRIIHLKVARLRSVVHHLAAVNKDHELVVVNVYYRTV